MTVLAQRTWWSRFHEYAWVRKFASAEHVVLDAAAGIPHMFKWHLAAKCKETWAVDADDRIEDMEAIKKATLTDLGEVSYKALLDIPNIYNNVKFVHSSIGDLPLDDMPKFDRIFCVSVLEHMPFEDILLALKQMKSVLKSNGLCVLTVDYPDISPQELIRAAGESGLVPVGDVIYELPPPADTLTLTQATRVLKIFRLVLAHAEFMTTKKMRSYPVTLSGSDGIARDFNLTFQHGDSLSARVKHFCLLHDIREAFQSTLHSHMEAALLSTWDGACTLKSDDIICSN